MSSRIFPSWEEMERYHHPLSQTERDLLKTLDTQLERDDSWSEAGHIADYNGWLIFSRPKLNLIEPTAIIYHPRKGFVVYDIFHEDLHHYRFNVKVEKVADCPELTPADNLTEEQIKSAKTVDKKSYRVAYDFMKGDEIMGQPDAPVKYYLDSITEQVVPQLGKYITDNNLKTIEVRNGDEVLTKTVRLKKPVRGVVIFEKNDSDDISTTLRKPFFFKYEEDGETQYLKSPKKSPYAWLIGRDSVQSGKLEAVVPDFLLNGDERVVPWCTDLNLEIINWLKPPIHRIQNCQDIVLSQEQQIVAKPSPGHHRVIGVAGSGKTIALAYRAAKLASMGYKVLVISFNITMWHYIRETIDGKTPFEFSWSNLHFSHFHGLCNVLLKRANRKWPESDDTDELFSRVVVTNVRNFVPDYIYPKFDAILIDEGQDFDEEWYKLLKDKFLGDRNEMVIVSDRRQNLYDRPNDWFYSNDYFHTEIVYLTNSFRLPAQIATVAKSFAGKFGLKSDLEFQISANNSSGSQVRWINHTYSGAQRFHVAKRDLDNMGAEERKQYEEEIKQEESNMDSVAELCLKAYHNFNSMYGTPSDIAVLVISHEWGNHLVQYFNERGVKSNNIFTSETQKNNFFLDKEYVKICTIHSFKGWELQNVILVIPHMISKQMVPADYDVSGGDHPCSKLDAAVYTAITRVQRNLIVINENDRYMEFGSDYPSAL